MDKDKESNTNQIITFPHDDGIFKYKNELVYGATRITEFASQIIQSYREIEYDKVKDLTKPPRSVKGVPDAFILKHIKDQAGRITFAPTQIFTGLTREEHLYPAYSFYQYPEPLYQGLSSAIEHHGEYCWKFALLNAYRVIDLEQSTSEPLPPGWITINIKPTDENYVTLLASAAYFMGNYYAKALALQKAEVAVKGQKMTAPNQNRYPPLGRVIYPACEELEKKQGELPSKGATKILMTYLESKNQASTQNNLWIVFTTAGKETVDAKRLGKYLKRYRDRNSKK